MSPAGTYGSAALLRQAIRRGEWSGDSTSGHADDFVHANLVVLPLAYAFEFQLYCQRNPAACALLEVLDVGCPTPRISAPGADIRTDVGAYRVFADGEPSYATESIVEEWTEDAVAFVIGGAITFEAAMLRAGIPLRHREQRRATPIFVTTRATVPAGGFGGPLVVSMRSIPADRISELVLLTSRYPLAHGAPVQVGAPEALGIDLARPDYGDPVQIPSGDVPVFWGCGVTPQHAALSARPTWMVTHAPGRPLVTDLTLHDLDRVRDLGARWTGEPAGTATDVRRM